MQDTSFSQDEIKRIIEKLKSDPAFRQSSIF